MRLTARRNQGQDDSVFHNATDAELSEHLWRINWRKNGYPFCGIYVICPDNFWPCKIGISQNPATRVAELQTACWKPIHIARYRYCGGVREAKAVEARSHSILRESGLSLSGEWFDIGPDKALDVVEYAALLEGVDISNEIPGEVRASLLRHHKARATAEHVRRLEEIEASL